MPYRRTRRTKYRTRNRRRTGYRRTGLRKLLALSRNRRYRRRSFTFQTPNTKRARSASFSPAKKRRYSKAANVALFGAGAGAGLLHNVAHAARVAKRTYDEMRRSHYNHAGGGWPGLGFDPARHNRGYEF